jgi:hypothetical protein
MSYGGDSYGERYEGDGGEREGQRHHQGHRGEAEGYYGQEPPSYSQGGYEDRPSHGGGGRQEGGGYSGGGEYGGDRPSYGGGRPEGGYSGGGGYGEDRPPSYGGGQQEGGYGGGNGDDYSSATQHAQRHRPEGGSGGTGAGESGLFGEALNFLKQNQGRFANEDVDESHMVSAHQSLYGGGGQERPQDSNTLGAGAAMQAVKMFTQGGSSGTDKNELIGMAMAQAEKLWDQQSGSGNVVSHCGFFFSFWILQLALLLRNALTNCFVFSVYRPATSNPPSTRQPKWP